MSSLDKAPSSGKKIEVTPDQLAGIAERIVERFRKEYTELIPRIPRDPSVEHFTFTVEERVEPGLPGKQISINVSDYNGSVVAMDLREEMNRNTGKMKQILGNLELSPEEVAAIKNILKQN